MRSEKASKFDLATIAKNSGFIILMMGLHSAGVAGTALFFVVLIFWALKGTHNAVKALLLAYLALISNVAFVPKNELFAPARLILMGVVFLSVMVEVNRRHYPLLAKKYIVALVVFCLAAAVMAVLKQHYMLISLLKIVSFFIGSFGILIGADLLRKRSTEMTVWYISIIVVSVLMGLASMVLGVGSNMLGGHTGLFNGPFLHSQTLGPVAAMMVAYLACIYLFTSYKLRWISIPLSVILLYFIYLSSSRTAMLVLGVSFIPIFFVFFTDRYRGKFKIRLNLSKERAVLIVCVFFLALVVVNFSTGGAIYSKAVSFVIKYNSKKYSEQKMSTDVVMKSREGQIKMMTENIREHPLTGIGFGISTRPSFARSVTLFSAPTEKGFLLLAVIEETGLIGFVLLGGFVIYFYTFYQRRRNIVAVVVFSALLAVNIGEMTFFSFGGGGGMMWLILGGGIMLGDQCVIRRSKKRRKV